MLQQRSYFIPVADGSQLHLQRFFQEPLGAPVFMLHGAIENGKIFYSKNKKGFAVYLAKHGFDVYVGDLRGRGRSMPTLNRHANYGQTEAIIEDIPAFIDKIIELRGEIKQHWIAHSWGGVLLSSYFARVSKHRSLVNSMVFFSSKRKISVWNSARLFYIDFIWQFVSPILTAIFGYLPAKKFSMGSDDETRKSLMQSIAWINSDTWIDTDGFNYGNAIAQLELPPIWYLTGINDKCLGHPQDVRNFMSESGEKNAKFSVLAKREGNLHNYNHVNILTHRDREKDHFPKVVEWLNTYTK